MGVGRNELDWRHYRSRLDRCAARHLGRIRIPQALPAPSPGEDDPSEFVREEAAQAIRNIEDRAGYGATKPKVY